MTRLDVGHETKAASRSTTVTSIWPPLHFRMYLAAVAPPYPAPTTTTLGTAARLRPSVPWQLAQFAAMSRPRFAYGPTSAAEAALISAPSPAMATAQHRSRNFIAPFIRVRILREVTVHMKTGADPAPA